MVSDLSTWFHKYGDILFIEIVMKFNLTTESQPPASPSCRLYEPEAIGPTPRRKRTEGRDVFFCLPEADNLLFWNDRSSRLDGGDDAKRKISMLWQKDNHRSNMQCLDHRRCWFSLLIAVSLWAIRLKFSVSSVALWWKIYCLYVTVITKKST